MVLRGICRKASQLGKINKAEEGYVRPAGCGCLLWQQIHIPLCLPAWVCCQRVHNASLKEINTPVVMGFVYLATEIIWKGQKCHI